MTDSQVRRNVIPRLHTRSFHACYRIALPYSVIESRRGGAREKDNGLNSGGNCESGSVIANAVSGAPIEREVATCEARQ